jgi:hypothetical protein
MEFDHFRGRSFTIGCNITVRNLSGERINSTGLVIGVMVPIDALEGLPRHAEEPTNLVDGHPSLREPCGACVPKRMRHDIVAKPRQSPGRAKPLVDALDGLVVPLDHIAPGNPQARPTAQMA